MLWRALIAAICLVLFYAVLPAFVELLNISVSAPLLTIIRVCVAGIAIFYVIRGPNISIPS